ncbi:MAG: ABC transporter permease [Steroidobacteraceae bacterium]
MLGYYLRLALNSLRRTPGLTALMVSAIALGIAACIVTLTVYHAMSGNPIWWKNNVLYAVTMDSLDPGPPFDPQHPALSPPELTYKDATYLARSDIPKRKVIMTQLLGMLNGAPGQSVPLRVMTRATTQDFFAMFDVPFEYGGGWRGNDVAALPEIVLTKQTNDTLFGGADSVGRSILWNGNRFRVVGVLRNWQPLPRFYDLVDGAFVAPQDTDAVYLPFSWVTALQALPTSNMTCDGNSGGVQNYQQFLNSECIWIQMWAELPSATGRARFHAFMDAYWAAQRKAGRFPRPLDNRLTNVGQWLKVNGVVDSDSRILLRVGFAFLAVCLINTVGILLTKFIRGAPIIGLRRALGASRRQIFMQHIVEVAVVSIAGALLGLALGAVGLAVMHAIYAQDSTYGMLAHFDPLGVAWALALAGASTLAAGLYPAWSVGRVAPAGYLKGR